MRGWEKRGVVYHSLGSAPTAGPQDISLWQFSGVIFATNSFNVGPRSAACSFSLRPEASIRIVSPSLSLCRWVKAFGRRTARCFPHLTTRCLGMFTLREFDTEFIPSPLDSRVT